MAAADGNVQFGIDQVVVMGLERQVDEKIFLGAHVDGRQQIGNPAGRAQEAGQVDLDRIQRFLDGKVGRLHPLFGNPVVHPRYRPGQCQGAGQTKQHPGAHLEGRRPEAKRKCFPPGLHGQRQVGGAHEVGIVLEGQPADFGFDAPEGEIDRIRRAGGDPRKADGLKTVAARSP